MNREEAIAKGKPVNETQHSMKRRSPWHDYYKKGIYMLTLVVEGRMPLLGTLKGNANAPLGSSSAPHIELSPLGQAILRDEVAKITAFYPQLEVWKVCIMPDHIHMIVRVRESLPEGCHLGKVVRGFKTGCSRAWWRLNPLPSGKTEGTLPASALPTPAASVPSPSPACVPSPSPASVPSPSPASVPSPSPASALSPSPASVPAAFPAGPHHHVLFEPGYNDKILLREGQLDNWKAYLDDNPRRLLLKRQNPHLFTVLHDLEVAGRKCQAVGNRFLLNNPDKMAVIVHRRYTDEENARLRDEWLACGERGGVLVSAAIAPKEKEVLREAMNRGYRIILLRENGFPKLYKPSGEAFDACSEGLLLQLSPWEYHMQRTTITRAQCLQLNAMAEALSTEPWTQDMECQQNK